MTDISLKISDMECVACVRRLGKVISAQKGVERAEINFAASTAAVSYDEGVTDIAMIAAAVRKAGFRVPVEEQELIPAGEIPEGLCAALSSVFGVKSASFAGGKITAQLWPVDVQARELVAACADCGCTVTAGERRGGDEDQELDKRMGLLKKLLGSAAATSLLMLELHPKAQFAVATALQFGPGRYFYKGALRDLRNRSFGMDTLISLSSTLIYLYSPCRIYEKAQFHALFRLGRRAAVADFVRQIHRADGSRRGKRRNTQAFAPPAQNGGRAR